jgi:hypothetical protein
MLYRAEYSVRRKGEGRATDVQEEKGPKVDFPSGTVETSHRAGLAVAWRPCHMWLLEAGAEYCSVKNSDHEAGVDEDGWSLSLKAQFNLKAHTRLGD